MVMQVRRVLLDVASAGCQQLKATQGAPSRPAVQVSAVRANGLPAEGARYRRTARSGSSVVLFGMAASLAGAVSLPQATSLSRPGTGITEWSSGFLMASGQAIGVAPSTS